jgi:hypothetical protein
VVEVVAMAVVVVSHTVVAVVDGWEGPGAGDVAAPVAVVIAVTGAPVVAALVVVVDVDVVVIVVVVGGIGSIVRVTVRDAKHGTPSQ